MMYRPIAQAIRIPMIAATATLGFALPVMAGDNNILFIEQDSSPGGLGNSLFVDQSLANDSIVAGDPAGSMPARQSGGNNIGEVTLDGTGGMVIFSQVNTNPFAGANTARIQGGSLSSILLRQDGFGNQGMLDIGAGNNSGSLTQIGNDNSGSVRVSGTDTTGELNQIGDSNAYMLDVTGNGAAVQWNQVGSAGAINTPAQVTTNAGTVTVTQQSF